MFKKYLASALSVLLISAGAVFGLAAPASAHTGNLYVEYECNTATGQYDGTAYVDVSNTDLVGQTYWAEGTTSFAGTPTSVTNPLNLTNGPVQSNGTQTITLGAVSSLPGDTTRSPWVYAFTTWTDNYTEGRDGGYVPLAGDCTVYEPFVAKADWGYTPATCTAAETLIVDNANLTNATWTDASLALNGTVGPGEYDLVAVPFDGAVWTDGQNGTFHVVLAGTLTEADCLASASVKSTPPTCTAAGGVAPDTFVNAQFGEPQYGGGQYTITAQATGVAHFPNPGQDGVSPDGLTKTFTGPIAAQLTEGCVASAQVKLNPGTCTETGTVEGGATQNATFGEPVYDYDNGTYTIVATRTGIATFPNPGQGGVSADGTQKTFTGPIPPTDPELCKIDGPKKPWVKDEKCVEGQPSDGSIEVKFGQLGDKIKFEITGGELENTITVLYGDAHKVPLPGGSYTVTAIAIDPWVFKDGATTFWIVNIDDAKCKVYPDPAEWQGEICVAGETEQGWIDVDYSGYLDEQIRYRITGPGVNELVTPAGDWTRVELDAGTYMVTIEPLFDWVKVKGDNFPVEITITSATNCVCFVPDQNQINEVSILADIAPVCSEAEVSITPPTCAESGKLVLGEVLDATWGEPIIIDGHYEVTATASGGYRFAPGDGVSDDGFTKVFEGDLPAATGNCGQLTTLSLTGGDGGNLPWVAGLALLLGIGGVFVAYRRPKTRVTES